MCGAGVGGATATAAIAAATGGEREERGWGGHCGSLGEIAYCHDSRLVEPLG